MLYFKKPQRRIHVPLTSLRPSDHLLRRLILYQDPIANKAVGSILSSSWRFFRAEVNSQMSHIKQIGISFFYMIPPGTHSFYPEVPEMSDASMEKRCYLLAEQFQNKSRLICRRAPVRMDKRVFLLGKLCFIRHVISYLICSVGQFGLMVSRPCFICCLPLMCCVAIWSFVIFKTFFILIIKINTWRHMRSKRAD